MVDHGLIALAGASRNELLQLYQVHQFISTTLL